MQSRHQGLDSKRSTSGICVGGHLGHLRGDEPLSRAGSREGVKGLTLVS